MMTKETLGHGCFFSLYTCIMASLLSLMTFWCGMLNIPIEICAGLRGLLSLDIIRKQNFYKRSTTQPFVRDYKYGANLGFPGTLKRYEYMLRTLRPQRNGSIRPIVLSGNTKRWISIIGNHLVGWMGEFPGSGETLQSYAFASPSSLKCHPWLF